MSLKLTQLNSDLVLRKPRLDLTVLDVPLKDPRLQQISFGGHNTFMHYKFFEEYSLAS